MSSSKTRGIRRSVSLWSIIHHARRAAPSLKLHILLCCDICTFHSTSIHLRGASAGNEHHKDPHYIDVRPSCVRSRDSSMVVIGRQRSLLAFWQRAGFGSCLPLFCERAPSSWWWPPDSTSKLASRTSCKPLQQHPTPPPLIIAGIPVYLLSCLVVTPLQRAIRPDRSQTRGIRPGSFIVSHPHRP